jgi:penicillin-binding protein 1A
MPKGRATRRRGSGGWAPWGKRLLLLTLALGTIGLVGGLIWVWPRCSGESCPDVRALRNYTPPQATRVFDGHGNLVAHLAPERRIVIPLERIPAHVAGAFLAVEDRRFFQHRGIDYRRVVGAAVRDLQTLSFEQGFSTITMQLARNVFPEHLTRAKTLPRKAWEIMLAREMEREFGKDEILEMYLNQIYLGGGLYGVEAAAQGYFGKSAAQLDDGEAAMLAALPRSPNEYNPRTNLIGAVERRNLVLSLMSDVGVISPERAADASAEPIAVVAPIEARGEAPSSLPPSAASCGIASAIRPKAQATESTPPSSPTSSVRRSWPYANTSPRSNGVSSARFGGPNARSRLSRTRRRACRGCS